MGKRLLPCPVCSGESFIESVTQGGLICTDCGAVSNQVEVADDDDPQLAPKTFIRTLSYKKVTEEESQAKRDRRTVLKQADRRDISTILEGLGRILDHQISSLISHNLCPAMSRATVRTAWFDLLANLSRSFETPVILSERYSKKLQTSLASWGIPDLQAQREMILRGISGRSNQHSILREMLDQRRIGHLEIKVVEDGPGVVFAHDWLSLFFDVPSIPDEVLLDLATPGDSAWVDKVINYEYTEVLTSSDLLTLSQRRTAIMSLFREITNNEKIRKTCLAQRPRKRKLKSNLPHIDMALTISLLIIGIRNAGGGVLGTHVLNWIARCQLPFYSAHTILSPDIDKLEYYRLSRSNHGYKPSVFSPKMAPTPYVIRKTLRQLAETVKLDVSPNDPFALLETCLNMMGLDPLTDRATTIMKKTLFHPTVVFPGEKPIFDKRKIAECSRLDPMMNTFEKIQESCVSDLSVSDLVAVVIALVMKLTFPQLHEPDQDPAIMHNNQAKQPDEDPPIMHNNHAKQPDEAPPIIYRIQSARELNGTQKSRLRDINLEWWDTLGEKSNVLQFFENELLNELRESVVEDIRHSIGDFPPCLDDDDHCVLTSGTVDNYRRFANHPNDGLVLLVLRDICAVTELTQKTDLDKLCHRLCHLEFFHFNSNIY